MIPKRNLIRAFKKAVRQPGYALEAFYKRSKSFLTYGLHDGKSAYPETISLFLTYRCNLRCKMCGQWGSSGSSRDYSAEELKKQLSLKDIERLLNDLKSFSPNITLFGGEPLLYNDLPEVIRMIKLRGMRCNMITNGVLLESKAESIMDAGIDEIIFSLDGPQDVHDKIRGVAGTYDRALAGFKKVQALKAEKGTRRPHINISSAIFEANYSRMDETIRSALEMGASSITFHHLIFLGKEVYEAHDKIFQRHFSCSSPDWAGFIREQLPDINPDKLIQIIAKLKTHNSKLTTPGPPIDISVYPNLTDEDVKRYYTSFAFVPDSYKRRCMSPWMVAYIFPDGSVKPCQSLNYAVGNIKETGFKEIWNSREALKFRSVLKKEKYFPVCPRCTEFYRY